MPKKVKPESAQHLEHVDKDSQDLPLLNAVIAEEVSKTSLDKESLTDSLLGKSKTSMQSTEHAEDASFLSLPKDESLIKESPNLDAQDVLEVKSAGAYSEVDSKLESTSSNVASKPDLEDVALGKTRAHRGTKKLDLMKFKLCQPSLIEASAGTGKTYTITNLVLRALLGSGSAETGLGRPLRIEDMLIVTFTNAATADLRLRVYERIRLARSSFELFLNRVMSQSVIALQKALDDGSLTSSIKSALLQNEAANEKAIDNEDALFQETDINLEALGIDDLNNSPKAEVIQDKKKELKHLFKKDAINIELSANRLQQKIRKEEINPEDVVDSDFWQELINVKNYDDEELKVLLANVNVKQVMAGSMADDVIIKLIEELLSRDPNLIRQAIIILIKAERNINASAICTIHSFCNSALTQIYALESGEAFNTELKIDLDYEIHEACYAVWRRLFYKKNSSNILLKQLDSNDPQKLYTNSNILNSVRLSNDNEGLWGYQLRGFKRLISNSQLEIDFDDDVENQILLVADNLEALRFSSNKKVIKGFEEFYRTLTYKGFCSIVDFSTEDFGPYIKSFGRGSMSKKIANKFTKLVVAYGQFAHLILRSSILLTKLKKLGLYHLDPALTKELEYLNSLCESLDLEGILSDEVVIFTAKSLQCEPPASFIDLKVYQDAVLAVGSSITNDDTLGSASELKAAPVPKINLPNLAPEHEFASLDTSESLSFNDSMEAKNADEQEILLLDIKTEYYKSYISFQKACSDSIKDLSSIKADTSLCTKTSKPTPEVIEQSDKFKNLIIEFVAKFSSLVEDNSVFEKESTALLRTMASIAIAFELERHCREKHIMSNDDLLRRLDNALNSNGEISKRLARLIRLRYPLAMIDEFQDTDPVQYNIFSKIYLNEDAVQEQAYCYLIGDPKQSIYAFRGSDINSYLKAKSAVERLTKSHGVYTLDTNYRSYDDVVTANNAIFNLTLNKSNLQPFEVKSIVFEDVKSAKKIDPNKGSPFKINNIQRFLADPSILDRTAENAAVSNEGKSSAKTLDANAIDANDVSANAVAANEVAANAVEKDSRTVFAANEVVGDGFEKNQGESFYTDNIANTYIINLGENFKTSDGLKTAYAKATAQMIYRVLKDGEISGKKVRSGDIAVLVRDYNESELIQTELRSLDIQSVYYSDKTSVLTRMVRRVNSSPSISEPSLESTELCYLMEAMCACTDRRKVMRLLGTNLLNLTSQEFIARSQGMYFEKEVQCLNQCAKTWQVFGFMPAFLQWANDPLHNVCARILSTENGERIYTNYCHIGEIIQSMHGKKGGIDAQLHWFYELIFNREELLDSQVTQKRLESEHDQIKIMTLHKSKGLEFPVVFMPFLWNFRKDNTNTSENFYSAIKYYDAHKYHHQVLDYYMNRRVEDDDGSILDPREIAKRDDQREQKRLLYVAITRAKLANFYCVGHYKVGANMLPSALVRMQGKASVLPSTETNDEAPSKSKSNGSMDYKNFIRAAFAHPQMFTVLDGDKCLSDMDDILSLHNRNADLNAERDNAFLKHISLSDGDAFTVKGNAHKDVILNLQNISNLKDGKIPPCAMSFVYKGAIDRSFNIISFSSLVSGNHSGSSKSPNEEFESTKDEGATDDMVALSNVLLEAQLEHNSLNESLEVDADKDEPVEANSVKDRNVSISAFMQSEIESGHAYKDGERIKTPEKICHTFPRGAAYGTLLHECLQIVLFDEVKSRGFEQYVAQELMPVFELRSDYVNVSHVIKGDPVVLREQYLNWFNDIMEAPIIKGAHHCFALSDLKTRSFEHEMNFLMSNTRFNTNDIDDICKDVADKLLPHHLTHLGAHLHIKADELEGFITGSIDLACRFDLNERLDLRRRGDLLCSVSSDSRDIIMRNIKNLEHEGLLDAESSFLNSEHESDIKYYVIDYKSNHLGDDYDSYTFDNLLVSIYEHRYDLQFLIYTLALYRLLKRRMGIAFYASYDECQAFYDKHIGGVIYLYLRGLKANYNRDQVSNGVFSTKIDFDVIYRLDQVFSDD